jgi:hypothetical protein
LASALHLRAGADAVKQPRQQPAHSTAIVGLSNNDGGDGGDADENGGDDGGDGGGTAP